MSDERFKVILGHLHKGYITEEEKGIIRNGLKELQHQLEQKENIIKEVRERAERELKIAEENIKNSEQWLEVEEEQEHAKKDIHTGKVIKRCMKMFLEILDKVEE